MSGTFYDGDRLPPHDNQYDLGSTARRWRDGYFGRDLRVTHGLWEDLRFPASGINPLGAASDPSRSNVTGMLEFSGTADNLIAGAAQMPHGWLEGSAKKLPLPCGSIPTWTPKRIST